MTFHDTDTPADVGNVHAVARALAAETAYPRSAIDWANHADAVTAITVTPRPKTTRLVVIDSQPVDMSWRDGTEACRDSSPALFYPEKNNEGGVIAKAKLVCSRCPVLDACRRHGIDHEHHGIWGGMTEGERRAERQRLSPVVNTRYEQNLNATGAALIADIDNATRKRIA